MCVIQDCLNTPLHACHIIICVRTFSFWVVRSYIFLNARLLDTWEVFHYIWRAPQMSFRKILFSLVKATSLMLWQTLCQKYRWRLHVDDGDTSSNFRHKLHCRTVIINTPSPGTPSTNLQPHENLFGELAKCSGTPHRCFLSALCILLLRVLWMVGWNMQEWLK